jgi:PAS domain S-box-containing protein
MDVITDGAWQEIIWNLSQEMGDYSLLVDRSGMILQASPGVTVSLGYNPSDLIHQNLFRLVHPEELSLVTRRFDEMLNSSLKSSGTEFRIRSASGSYCWSEFCGKSFLDNPAIGGVMLLLRDSTARAAARQTQEAQESSYRALYEHSLSGILLTSPDGRISGVNAMACALLGRSEEEICRIGRGGIVDPDDPHLAEFLEERDRTGKATGEMIHIRGDGSRFPAQVTSVIVDDGAWSFVIFDDISLRRQAEQKLLEAKNVAESANRVKSEFLAMVSHELRTPLTVILGFSETLRDELRGPLNPHQQRMLRGIEQSGRQLLSLINDLLDLPRIEAEKMSIAIKPVGLEEICSATLSFVKEQAQRKQLRLSYLERSAPKLIRTDPLRLKQILLNLLTNAIKFTPNGGEVGLEVIGDDLRQQLHFTVRDSGIGISAQDQLLLFRPFTQVDSSLTREYEGTGLGLTLVSRLAALMGGEITLKSEPGAGSRFTVSFPYRLLAGEEA